MTIMWVPFDEIEGRLRAGWMALIPSRAHRIMDEYRIPMVWLCACDRAPGD